MIDKNVKFTTIRSSYDPLNQDTYISLGFDGMPDLVLIAEQIKVYNDNYSGIVFYKRVDSTDKKSASQAGGTSVVNHGFSRSPGI